MDMHCLDLVIEGANQVKPILFAASPTVFCTRSHSSRTFLFFQVKNGKPVMGFQSCAFWRTFLNKILPTQSEKNWKMLWE